MSNTKVVTGLVRFSYVHAFEPHSVEEGQPKKYSVSILIPKKNKDTLKKLEEVIENAAVAGKAKFNNKDPHKVKNFKWPLRDGDEEREDDPTYKGMYFVNASSNQKPGIVDADRDEILDESDFYSGCWGRASLNFFAFNTSGNMGVACGLNNLQKLKDDEPLGGARSKAEDDFADDFEDDDLLG